MPDIAIEVMNSQKFFSPVSYWKEGVHPALASARADAPPVAPSGPSSLISTDTGLVSCICADVKDIDPKVQATLDVQKQYMISLTGLASSYVRTQANTKQNTALMFDSGLWLSVYNHLPLMAPPQLVVKHQDTTIQGVEIATKFIEMILGVAVTGGEALAPFTIWLSGLGSQIRAGIKSTNSSFNFTTLAIALTTQKLGNQTRAFPYLKYYSINFTQSQFETYSYCGSRSSYRMVFDMKTISTLWNYEVLADRPDVKEKLDRLIKVSQLDDIESSANFFAVTA
ncbi:hypothetical protein [Edaphobacter modestus]|uniref:Virulence factor Evf domain-containing protein n=1 Tax=Edaphobacter modestus TaxID=388466 RepID=A0A4V2G1E3_9BACT|nr:hypothetical protein [Edaphobacter modestus]RZU28896.1 hypothetical protein BDD14_6479 [Edaphobacter modestus]